MHVVSHALNGSQQRLDGTVETLVIHALRADGFDTSEDGTGRASAPLAAFLPNDPGGHINGISPSLRVSEGGGSLGSRVCIGPAHDANNGSRRHNGVMSGTPVRRLTPLECERLQGFPDDYTLVPYRGKIAKDGPRYRAIGNSFPVPVVRWIGERIQRVSGLMRSLPRAQIPPGIRPNS